MMMDEKAEDQVPPASLALERLGIPHRVFRHAGDMTSLEQAANDRGQRPEQAVRIILLRVGQDQLVMVLVGGGAQIPWQKLRKHLAQNRLTLASEEGVLRITGYTIGSVSPFGLRQHVRILIDRPVLAQEQISGGSGRVNTGIVMRRRDLLRALRGPEIVDLVQAA